MTQPAQSHLFNCVLWHGIDNGNLRHSTPDILPPDILTPTLNPLLRHFNPRHYPCKPEVSKINYF